jgi:hypothetical protein
VSSLYVSSFRRLTPIKGNDLRKVGLSTLTDILNVVAPPISEHEVLQVWLSHDMQGYEGIETVVYSGFSRVTVTSVQDKLVAYSLFADHATS